MTTSNVATVESVVDAVEIAVDAAVDTDAANAGMIDYVPAFAATSPHSPVNQRELDDKFARRLSICEFSLDISAKGNIIGVLRVPPVQAGDRFYGILRARFNNARIRNYQSAVDAKNGWGQFTLNLSYAGSYPDALWLVDACKPRSFPNIAGYQELQSRVQAKSVFLLDVLRSGQINFVDADYRSIDPDFWPEGITQERVAASPAHRNAVIKKVRTAVQSESVQLEIQPAPNATTLSNRVVAEIQNQSVEPTVRTGRRKSVSAE
jgi:hypothetical protein